MLPNMHSDIFISVKLVTWISLSSLPSPSRWSARGNGLVAFNLWSARAEWAFRRRCLRHASCLLPDVARPRADFVLGGRRESVGRTEHKRQASQGRRRKKHSSMGRVTNEIKRRAIRSLFILDSSLITKKFL